MTSEDNQFVCCLVLLRVETRLNVNLTLTMTRSCLRVNTF